MDIRKRPQADSKAGGASHAMPLGGVLRKFDMPPEHVLNYRIREFCAAFGVSRSVLYLLIKAGAIRATKVGKSTLIPRAEALRWQRELERRAGIDT